VLTIRPRYFDPFARVALGFVPVAVMMLLGQWFLEWIGVGSDKETAWLLAFIALGFLLSGVIYNWSKTIDTKKSFHYLDRDKIIFMRMPGDETSAVIAAAHLISWAMGKVTLGPTGVLWRAQDRVEQWRQRLLVHWPLILASLIIGAIGFFYCEVYQDLRIGASIFLALTLIAIALIAILVQGGAFAWLLAFMATAGWLVPMTTIVGLVGWPTIGPEMLIAAMLFETTAEPTPPGNWNLIQLNPDVGAAKRGRLQHSAIHENPEALAAISEWVKMRSKELAKPAH
jgi:hypothetical protein